MENAILIVHLVLVVFLVGIVLLQRSEGGALGMGGGGGGGGGVMSGRGAATALQRATWYIAIGFIVTSLTLTIMATTERSTGSVFDQAAPGGLTLPTQEGDLPVTFTPPTIEDDALVPAIGGTDAAPAPLDDPDNIVPAPASE